MRESIKVLQEKVSVLTKYIEEVEGEKSKLLSQLEEQRTRLTEQFEEERIKLTEQLEISMKSSQDDSIGKVSAEKDNLKRERDTLKSAKDKLEKEKLELATEKEDLVEQLKKQRAAREKLEEAFANEQKRSGLGLDTLRKNLVQHLHDINAWKSFLEESETAEFQANKIQLVKEKEIVDKSFDEQLVALASALEDENNRLQKMLTEKDQEKKEKSKPKEKEIDGDDADSKEYSEEEEEEPKKKSAEKKDSSVSAKKKNNKKKSQ